MMIRNRPTAAEAQQRLAGLIDRPWQPRLAFTLAQRGPAGDVLVCLFLRGAADALNIIVPHGDEDYYRWRPTIAIGRPDDQRLTAGQRTIDLDGFFGLHPALAPLQPAWQAGQLSAVHACGAPDESRSHFQAMELMERGLSTVSGPASGWIGRHLATLDSGNRSPLRAVGLGERLPRALYGPVPAVALRSIAAMHLPGEPATLQTMQRTLAQLYSGAAPLAAEGQAVLAMLQALEGLDPTRAPAARGWRPTDLDYPAGPLGLGLRQVALLIRANVGLEAACLDLGGWDTHISQGGSEGWMARLLAELAGGLAAFVAELGDELRRVSVVVLSEFGRRARENGGLGTDHGHGGLLLLLGGGIAGRRIFGQWPGLAADQLVGPGDLAVTTDYRDVLAELVARRLNNPNLPTVFPNYQPRFIGVTR